MISARQIAALNIGVTIIAKWWEWMMVKCSQLSCFCFFCPPNARNCYLCHPLWWNLSDILKKDKHSSKPRYHLHLEQSVLPFPKYMLCLFNFAALLLRPFRSVPFLVSSFSSLSFFFPFWALVIKNPLAYKIYIFGFHPFLSEAFHNHHITPSPPLLIPIH